MLWLGGRRGPAAKARKGGRREVSAPGRSLQVSLVRSPGVRGCTELHGFLAHPTPALSLCKNSRPGAMDTPAEAASGVTVGYPSAERTRLRFPRCFLGLEEGHLRDCYDEPEKWQRWSQRGCFPCLKGAESPHP